MAARNKKGDIEMKRFITLTAVLLLALPVIGSAKDMNGKFSLGFFNSDAPVGIRYWASPQIGIDLGVGFEMKDVYFNGSKEGATSFWVDFGVPYVIWERDRANFFIRPGAMIAVLDDRVYGTGTLDETWTQITFSLTPGAEIFFGDNFSLSAGHGIAVQMTSVPDAVGAPRGGETETEIRSFDASVTHIGFHYYFF